MWAPPLPLLVNLLNRHSTHSRADKRSLPSPKVMSGMSILVARIIHLIDLLKLPAAMALCHFTNRARGY